jgi:hypothetical protein
MTPSPNEIVWEKFGAKRSDKKQQKATTHLSLFVASAPEISSLLVSFCRYTRRDFISL